MEAAEFVGRLFLSRDVAHSAHLMTRSYAVHKALQKFYEALPDATDAFAEAYQGRFGLIGAIELQRANDETNILEFLEKQLAALEEGRYEVCPKEETAIQNLIDEIVAHYLSVLYKLRFLS